MHEIKKILSQRLIGGSQLAMEVTLNADGRLTNNGLGERVWCGGRGQSKVRGTDGLGWGASSIPG